jgi:glucose-6-phosphate isomerase
MPLRVDDARMMMSAVPSGVTPDEWNALALRFAEAHRAVEADRAAGRHGFTELGAQVAEIARVSAFAAEARGRFDDVVVLGIGGSALGAIALRTAVGGESAGPRLHVADNVDPASFSRLLASVALPRTLWLVVSKSGSTVETLAQHAIVRERLAAAGLEPRRHVAIVTDPDAGPLRAIAARDGIPAFAVPANVGGRFSVLTPVGLLPAAVAAYDVAGSSPARAPCSRGAPRPRSPRTPRAWSPRCSGGRTSASGSPRMS